MKLNHSEFLQEKKSRKRKAFALCAALLCGVLITSFSFNSGPKPSSSVKTDVIKKITKTPLQKGAKEYVYKIPSRIKPPMLKTEEKGLLKQPLTLDKKPSLKQGAALSKPPVSSNKLASEKKPKAKKNLPLRKKPVLVAQTPEEKRLAGYFSGEAKLLYQRAQDNGLLETIEKVAKATDVPVSYILTIVHFESSGGVKETKHDATGIAQIQKRTFLTWVARHKSWLVETLQKIDSKTAKEFDRLTPYISCTPETRCGVFDEKGFKKKTNHSLKKTILAYRNDWNISLLLTCRDIQESLPGFKAQAKKSASPVAANLIKTCGDVFLARTMHNFGSRGSLLLLSHSKLNDNVSKVIGEEKADQNGWKERSLQKMLKEFAYSTYAMDIHLQRLILSPPQSSINKQASSKPNASRGGKNLTL